MNLSKFKALTLLFADFWNFLKAFGAYMQWGIPVDFSLLEDNNYQILYHNGEIEKPFKGDFRHIYDSYNEWVRNDRVLKEVEQ